MMKLKYSIYCGLDVHKNVIVATIIITTKTEYPNICKNLFQPSTRIFKGFTTDSSRITVITFVWNPLESIGFLFLIILKMTWIMNPYISVPLNLLFFLHFRKVNLIYIASFTQMNKMTIQVMMY